MNYKIQPTPAVALGAYEITPLEAAGAYTLFANHGEYVEPTFVSLVRSGQGSVVYKAKPERRQAIDQRLAYVMTNLMQEVLASGTARGIPARYGLDFPIAGKTGTSHDGWFAGYDSDLLCVVWVGFDDNRELDLQGADSAAPIWGEFMKRAAQIREFRDPKTFEVPGGIVSIVIDPDTGMPATANCPHKRTEVYIAGSEPMGACTVHGGRLVTNNAGWDTSTAVQPEAAEASDDVSAAPDSAASAAKGSPRAERSVRPRAPAQKAQASPPPPQQPPKKGFWSRLLGVFK
jgi:penicillin-binding protein 1B